MYVMFYANFLQLCNVQIFSDICDIPKLNGENYKIWKERILLQLGCMDIDYAIRKYEPPINKSSLKMRFFFMNNGNVLSV